MTRGDIRRVVLGATSFADAESVLEIALGIAAETGGEVFGLLIEEDTILMFSDHPAARTISHRGETLGSPGLTRMQQAFRQDASRFEAQLSRAAAERALRWRFSHRAGRLPVILTEETAAGDLVLLGGEPWRSRPAEVVLLAGDAWDDELFALAAGLAGSYHARLRVLRPAGAAPVPRDLPVPVMVHVLATPEDLAAELSRLGSASLLVADLTGAAPVLGGYLEHARFTRLLRARRSDTGPVPE